MRRQQETMTLYSQYGANPMGGCLPMLIQMPIWIAMFNFVPNAIELRQQGFIGEMTCLHTMILLRGALPCLSLEII